MLFFFSFFVLKIERNMLCCLVGLMLDLRVRNAQPSWPISIARTSDVSTVPLRVFHLPGQRPDAHRGTAPTTPVARQTQREARDQRRDGYRRTLGVVRRLVPRLGQKPPARRSPGSPGVGLRWGEQSCTTTSGGTVSALCPLFWPLCLRISLLWEISFIIKISLAHVH